MVCGNEESIDQVRKRLEAVDKAIAKMYDDMARRSAEFWRDVHTERLIAFAGRVCKRADEMEARMRKHGQAIGEKMGMHSRSDSD